MTWRSPEDAFGEIHALLARHIGLDVGSIGARAIESAVRARMAAIGAAEPGAYLDLVVGRREELSALVEEIVVPETWFLRDRVPFSNLASHAVATRAARRGEPFRVLSLPCSTGEEPYSIAIALMDAGSTPAELAIDAIDISARALAVAERAVYGASSFRGEDAADARDRHFIATPAGWELSADARAGVRFTRGNLFEPGCFEPGRRYHAIFCRNLLIYLTATARAQAIVRLEQMLEPRGLFVVGHAEALQVMDPRFRAIDVAGAFTFMRVSDLGAARRAAASRPPPAKAPHERQETARMFGLPRPSKPAPGRVAAAPASAPAQEPRDLLAEAAALADRGELRAAADLCAQHFQVAGPDAQGYALLGTIRQAGGQIDDAEAMFSRALYCDPGHYQSLVQLALLRERRGDREGAENLRRRAGKARDRGGSR